MPSKINTIIGFDFGTKKIGVAKANTLTLHATGLDTVHYSNDEQLWQAIDNIIKNWQPEEIALGVPVHMDEKKQPITELALQFSKQLEQKYKLTVNHVDERLTSIEAKSIIKQQRQAGQKKKTKKGDVDKIAACLILQQWLNLYSNE